MEKPIEADDKIYILVMLDVICEKLEIPFDDIIKRVKEIKRWTR